MCFEASFWVGQFKSHLCFILKVPFCEIDGPDVRFLLRLENKRTIQFFSLFLILCSHSIGPQRFFGDCLGK